MVVRLSRAWRSRVGSHLRLDSIDDTAALVLALINGLLGEGCQNGFSVTGSDDPTNLDGKFLLSLVGHFVDDCRWCVLCKWTIEARVRLVSYTVGFVV